MGEKNSLMNQCFLKSKYWGHSWNEIQALDTINTERSTDFFLNPIMFPLPWVYLTTFQRATNNLLH